MPKTVEKLIAELAQLTSNQYKISFYTPASDGSVKCLVEAVVGNTHAETKEGPVLSRVLNSTIAALQKAKKKEKKPTNEVTQLRRAIAKYECNDPAISAALLRAARSEVRPISIVRREKLCNASTDDDLFIDYQLWDVDDDRVLITTISVREAATWWLEHLVDGTL